MMLTLYQYIYILLQGQESFFQSKVIQVPINIYIYIYIYLVLVQVKEHSLLLRMIYIYILRITVIATENYVIRTGYPFYVDFLVRARVELFKLILSTVK